MNVARWILKSFATQVLCKVLFYLSRGQIVEEADECRCISHTFAFFFRAWPRLTRNQMTWRKLPIMCIRVEEPVNKNSVCVFHFLIVSPVLWQQGMNQSHEVNSRVWEGYCGTWKEAADKGFGSGWRPIPGVAAGAGATAASIPNGDLSL